MKRIISVIVVCSMLLCFLTAHTVSFAEETDTAYVSDLLKSLGIELKVSDGVTRAQFIYNVMQMVNSANTGSLSANIFEDVSSDDYFFGAVSSAVSLGIISPGVKFRPDDSIKIAEAYKIMVSALGMGFEAEVRGGYPTGYLAVAYNSGLSIDSTDDRISVEQMYCVAESFLDACPYVIDSVGSGQGDVSYISNKTVLEYYHKIIRVEGVVTASENTGIYLGSAAVNKGYAAIDDVIYKTAVNVSDCLAKNSEAYVKYEDGKSEIVYIREKDNKSVAVDGKDIFSVSGGRISYVDESGNDKSTVLSSAPAYIYNFKADASLSASDLVGFDGMVELVSSDGDGKIDAIILRQYEIIYVSSVNSYEKTIFDTNGSMKMFDSDDVDITVKKNGKISSLEDIAEGDLIKLYSSVDNLVQLLDVTVPQSIDGVLTSVNKGEKTVTISDNEYRYDDYFETHYSSMWTLGANMTFYLTDTGRVFALSKTSDTDTFYGYFIAVKRDGTMDTKVKAKVLCEDGSVTALEFAPKIIIDGKLYKASDIVTDGSDATIKAGLVRYRTNADGMVRLIDTAENKGVVDKSLSTDNNLTLFEYPTDKYSSIWYIQNTGMFAPYFKVTSATKVFVVSDDDTLDDKYRYTTHTSAYFNTSRYAAPDNLLAYNVSTVGEAEAIVVKGGSGTQTVGTSSSGGVVVSANKGMDVEGTECIIVTVFSKNSYIRLYLSDEMLINSLRTNGTADEIPLVAGDYVRYISRSDNHISAISKDFDYSTKTVYGPWENHANGVIFYYGDVYDKGNNLVSVAVENNPKFEADISDASRRYNLSLPSVFVVYDSQTQTAYKGSINDIITYLNNPGLCSKILLRSYNGTPNDAIIYK